MVTCEFWSDLCSVLRHNSLLFVCGFGWDGKACDIKTKPKKKKKCCYVELMNIEDGHGLQISSTWHLAQRFHIAAALSGFIPTLRVFASQQHVIQRTVSIGTETYHLSAPRIWLNDFFQDTSRRWCYFYPGAAVAFAWSRKLCQRLFWVFYAPGQAI